MWVGNRMHMESNIGMSKNKIAIIDDVVVFHTRPVLTGETYRGLENPFEFAINESMELHKKWNIQASMKENRNNGVPLDGEVKATLYKQIFKEMEKGIPKDKRIWPNYDFKSLGEIFQNFYKPSSHDATAFDWLLQNE